MRTTLLPGLLLLIACASPPVEPPACAMASPLEVSEGGALTLPMLDGRELEASAGLTLAILGDTRRAYAEYGAAPEQSITVSGVDCEPTTLPVTVRPLEWQTLSDWDGADGPLAREYGAFWMGDDDAGLWAFGGFHYEPAQFTPASDLWYFDFDAGLWEERPSSDAPTIPGSRVARGAEPGTVLLLGGAAITADGSLDTPPSLHVLRYAGGSPSWSEAAHAAASPGSYTGAFVRDTHRDRWLSVCGVDSRRLGVHCAVQAYDAESGWTDVEVAGAAPPGRFGFHYAYDEESDRVLIAGGQVGSGNLDIVGDTWALDLSSSPPEWTRLFEDSEEVRRRNGAFVLDPLGRRLILWGGTADGMTSKQGLTILRIDPGQERWDHVETPSSVPARASGFAVYDASRERAVMGFGNSTAIFTDLYSLSL